MAADTPIPLCTSEQFLAGPFADLAAEVSGDMLTQFLIEGTRICEDEAGRRLAPFTLTETHRAEGVDPDEYPGVANMPMDIRSTLGMSYAQALGTQDLVRHCWLHQYASKYPEMWAYSDVSVTIIRSYGGTMSSPLILSGPEPDTGHLWFQLGTYLPIGSRIQVTYSGGYQPVPASLVRANRYTTAYLIVRELNPGITDHNPDQLKKDAIDILGKWGQS
ncbi:MAG TPA: hypothetical protein VFQ44_01955 [Streptosporangiaceae bacterium]|nr:hypothetical protein [Streptosporangiaceae bacterium]